LCLHPIFRFFQNIKIKNIIDYLTNLLNFYGNKVEGEGMDV
jgi:hypothetical protein